MYQTSNMGWQCPVCLAVNAPWVQQCPCGGNQAPYTITVGPDTGNPYWYQSQNIEDHGDYAVYQ